MWQWWSQVASFTMEANPWLAKRPLQTNGCLANLELTFLVIEATERNGNLQSIREINLHPLQLLYRHAIRMLRLQSS